MHRDQWVKDYMYHKNAYYESVVQVDLNQVGVFLLSPISLLLETNQQNKYWHQKIQNETKQKIINK